MSQLYRSRHSRRYRPVRVRESRSSIPMLIDKMGAGAHAVITTLGALAILDGAVCIMIGLR